MSGGGSGEGPFDWEGDVDLLAEVGDEEAWVVDVDDEDKELLGPAGLIPGYEERKPDNSPRYQLSDLLGFRHGRVRKSVRYSPPSKVIKTLALFTSLDWPNVDLFLCSRCNEVTVGILDGGANSPCPRCSCALDMCYEQRLPQDIFCADHRADNDMYDEHRLHRRNSLWAARLLSDPPVELESFDEQFVYDPYKGEFYESFEDWVSQVNLNWLKNLAPNEYLLLPCKHRRMPNPFSREHLELLAEDTWGELNPLLEDTHLQFVLKSLSDLSERLTPIDIFRNARLRVEPTEEYPRYLKWKAELARLAREEREAAAREACQCPDCLAHRHRLDEPEPEEEDPSP